MEKGDILLETLLIVCVCVNIVEGLHGNVAFSTSLSDILIFKRFNKISIETCSTECLSRRRCRHALYNRAAAVCSLIQTSEKTTPVLKVGDILMNDFDAVREVNQVCGIVSCSERETCIKDDDKFICKATECAIVKSVFYTRIGNVYEIHSKLYISYLGSEHRTQITCGEDGNWTGVRGCCEEACPSGIVVWPFDWTPYYCDMDTDGGRWVVFQRRQDGSENFRRGWTDYVDGFGKLGGEFWLGLEEMYRILSMENFELRIELESFEGQTRYAKYSHFRIDGPADNYRLHVSGYSGTAGMSFTYHDGYMFSTIDNDNDVYGNVNCADLYNGGWWYGTCHKANLNGKYFHGGHNTTSYADHIHWKDWFGYFISLKSTEMKFRNMQ